MFLNQGPWLDLAWLLFAADGGGWGICVEVPPKKGKFSEL